ncbi:MAG: RNA 3'-terminal phosphate cyclase [Hyphomicrobium sp.]|jgi:RNA 3'-terminal phosphate cyclase (ATP)|nr:RNA 3'-terminal phosphate cyclase [Hyphomicrobium sp.]
MLLIDGSQGEGGGQVLRTALTLSMITGEPFGIENIRAGRKKPGLLRQHLTCIEAASAISSAEITGAHLGSRALKFAPRAIKGGTYKFAIGSAGSTALVFQTVFLALLTAKETSSIELSGGTHNPSAPTFDYLERAFLPLLARMGAKVEARLERHGFYPAGGGCWRARVEPCAALKPIEILERGVPAACQTIAAVANIPFDVAEREVATVLDLMTWPKERANCRAVEADGPGNVVQVELGSENITEIFTGFGERRMPAETVAANVVDEVRAYLAAGVPVGPHLADQLLLPMALAGGGAFFTQHPTAHTRTNIEIIEKFLPLSFKLKEEAKGRWRISVEA